MLNLQHTLKDRMESELEVVKSPGAELSLPSVTDIESLQVSQSTSISQRPPSVYDMFQFN